MKRQIELVRYGIKKLSIKSSVFVILISLQIVNCSSIYEERQVQDNAQRINDVNELTFCQQLRNFESRRARDYKDKGSRVQVRIPRCNRIGNFEPVQCSNDIDNSYCFCVDEYGIEIPGTRADTETDVNCSLIGKDNDCPAASCRMFCPSGFARNETTGCSICKCHDVCSDVKCPNGHECEPIEIRCKNEPCPPIPTCRKARSLNEFCPAGSPLSIAGTIRPFLCGNDAGKPQCPPIFKCVVQPGNDYGVCCPASLKYEKPGTCPNSAEFISTQDHGVLCGSSCSHDLECPQMQKCCDSTKCGKTCQNTRDATLCHQAKLQSEILAISEREGRGYIPQCDEKSGQFMTKQCSNNGLVCWCANPENGNKIKGTIGAAKSVKCDNVENLLIRSGARSMDGNNQCDQNICAAVCQYGFKTDHNGCSTCECEEPCEGFICPVGSKCVVAKDQKCTSGSGLCQSEPICQPDLIYSNPCEHGVPLTHNITEEIAYCQEELNSSEYQVKSFLDASDDESVEGRSLMSKITCPNAFKCTRLKGQSESVCCPLDLVPAAADNQEVEETTVRQQSMCEYLRDFSDRMEGTEEGMALAIKPPKCNADGSYVSMQCQLRRVTVTKAEHKKVLEQNNIREMRRMLIKNRRKRDVETLKLVRVDNNQSNRRSDEGLDSQVVLEFLKKRIFEAPERFLAELFGDNLQGRTARVIDIQAEDYEDDDDDDDESDARDDRKLALKSQNRINSDLVEVEVEQCFCVDRFGTEIPNTRGSMNVTEDGCNEIRENIECLDLTCRMGCDYGFVIDPSTQCPTCQCRDPCDSVQCDDNHECRTVEVSCEDAYCAPVPSCFPKKQGQCPFLVPPAGEDNEDACAFECRSDNHCSASKKCCSNGCGTVCVEPMLKSACQHLQSIQIHQAIELGIPAKQKYIAQCNEDGTWKTIQCGPNNVCFCVDERGNEKSGTRTSDGIPNCSVSKSSNCPKVRCKYCEHGYIFDDNGCKTCQCKDLCKEIKCPADEQCELVQVECINSHNNTLPCPRLPICVPIRDSICTEGLPLKQGGREINCGPDATDCPTTHTCNLNPITKHGVCCAKSRDVCFESIDSSCILNDNDVSETVVKYRFNPRHNKCTPLRMSKNLKGNSSCAIKNLFHSEQACRSVCPVLTQCERLKLKNSIAARRRADKSDIWFRPICDPETGNWSSVQCIGENMTENTRVCWCADKKGSPIKGSLTKGVEPVCNYRQARRRIQEPADPVMEELIRQITFLTDENNFLDDDEDFSVEKSLASEKIIAATERALEISENLGESTKKLIASTTRCDSLRQTARFAVTCDERGNFSPMQCNHETCWCIDEAGNQLPFSNTFRKGSKKCTYTPLDAIEIELNLINPNHVKLTNLYDVMFEDVQQLIGDESFVNFRVHENADNTVTLKFDLIDDEKVNQAFAIEEMSKEDNLYLFHGMLKVDMRQSKFSHKIPMEVISNAQKSSLGIPQSTFHTIVFIIATSSAFIISILVIYVMLKKGRSKDDKTHYVNNKNLHSGDKYIDYTSPIFVLSANDLPRTRTNDS